MSLYDLPRELLESFLASPLAQFRPWATDDGTCPQGAFFRAAGTHKTRIFRGGNRSGKTHLVCFDTVMHLLNWHPFSQFRGPQRWWMSGLDWDFGIGQVLWPKLWGDETPANPGIIPRDQVRKVTWRARNRLPLSVLFRNGSILEFKSGDGGARKYQGASLHGLVIDEEHEEDVVEEGQMRLLDHDGYLSVSLTPVRRLRWVQRLESRPTTFSVQASTIDAARAGTISLDRVLEEAAELPEHQRRVRVYGDFVALEGMVYPDFARESHVAVPDESAGRLILRGHDLCEWPPPRAWPRYAAMDFGFNNPSAVLIAAHDQVRGRLIVYRCLYARGIRAFAWGQQLGRLLPPLAAPLICDHDAAGRAELEAQGIRTESARKALHPGTELVSRLLQPASADGFPQLVLVEDGRRDPFLGRCDALPLRKELENYHLSRSKSGAPDARERPVKKDDHACLAPDEEVFVRGAGWTRLDALTGSCEILTPFGWEFTHGAALTRISAPVTELALGNGNRCVATEDHLFWNGLRWASVTDIIYPQRLRTWNDGSHYRERDEAGFQRAELLALRPLLQQAEAWRREGVSPPGCLVCGELPDPDRLPRPPCGWRHGQQRALEPGAAARARSFGFARDAGVSGPSPGEHPQGHRGGPGLAPIGGGPSLAPGARLAGGRETAPADEGATGLLVLRNELRGHAVRGGSVEVLPLELPPGCATRAEALAHGRSNVWCLATPSHSFLLRNGLVSHNCDALRYLCAGVVSRIAGVTGSGGLRRGGYFPVGW